MSTLPAQPALVAQLKVRIPAGFRRVKNAGGPDY
jgi:hypothetical protein